MRLCFVWACGCDLCEFLAGGFSKGLLTPFDNNLYVLLIIRFGICAAGLPFALQKFESV